MELELLRFHSFGKSYPLKHTINPPPSIKKKLAYGLVNKWRQVS